MRFAAASSPDFAPAPPPRCWPTGFPPIDAALSGGFVHGAVHEFYAAELADAAAAAGFVGAIASGLIRGEGAPAAASLWVRSTRGERAGGAFQANGLNELAAAGPYGFHGGLVSIVPDALAMLKIAVDALRCAALGAVIVEGWGAMRELDLTASRRLALAAAQSGVPLLLLRIEATPSPSAARTRWQVAAAPSHALPGNAPGRPCFEIELLRQRGGPCGQAWQVEWDRDRGKFREAHPGASHGALPGTVVSVSAGGAVAGAGRAGTRAA